MEGAGFETVFVNELHNGAKNRYLSNRVTTLLVADCNHAFEIVDINLKVEEFEALASRLMRETISWHRSQEEPYTGAIPALVTNKVSRFTRIKFHRTTFTENSLRWCKPWLLVPFFLRM